MAFNAFIVFVVKNWTQIDYDLDSKTRRQIEEVFEIENSNAFRIYKWLSDNLDPFFRYIFLAAFVLFECTKMADLFEQEWLGPTSIALFVVSIILWMFLHVRNVQKEHEWPFKKAIDYYVKFRCIFPKATLLKTKLEETRKNKKKKQA